MDDNVDYDLASWHSTDNEDKIDQASIHSSHVDKLKEADKKSEQGSIHSSHGHSKKDDTNSYQGSVHSSQGNLKEADNKSDHGTIHSSQGNSKEADDKSDRGSIYSSQGNSKKADDKSDRGSIYSSQGNSKEADDKSDRGSIHSSQGNSKEADDKSDRGSIHSSQGNSKEADDKSDSGSIYSSQGNSKEADDKSDRGSIYSSQGNSKEADDKSDHGSIHSSQGNSKETDDKSDYGSVNSSTLKAQDGKSNQGSIDYGIAAQNEGDEKGDKGSVDEKSYQDSFFSDNKNETGSVHSKDVVQDSEPREGRDSINAMFATAAETDVKSSRDSVHSPAKSEQGEDTNGGRDSVLSKTSSKKDELEQDTGSVKNEDRESDIECVKHVGKDNDSLVKGVAAGIVISDLRNTEEEKPNDDDDDKASVETESLGEEKVLTVDENEQKTSDKENVDQEDSKSNHSDKDDDDEDDDDDDSNWKEENDYELFDTSSDDSDDEEFKLRRRDTTLGHYVEDGPKFPQYVTEFYQVYLHEEISRGIVNAGIEKPTDLQSRCLPQSLKWKDCIIQSPPGTGKTMTYVITALQLLPRTTNRASARSGIRSMVVCPTREMCLCVAEEFQRVGQFMSNVSVVTLVGGTGRKEDQINLTKMRPNIIIGTPGKIAACLNNKLLGLSQLKTLVFEHCDMMMKTKEFKKAVHQIFKVAPKKKQVILTSITAPGMTGYTKDAFKMLTESKKLMPSTLSHYYTNVEDNDRKKETIFKILDQVVCKQAIVFTNSTETCDDIAKYLNEKEITAGTFHGSIAKEEKSKTYTEFSEKRLRFLVTTDVMSRGTASDNVDLVINYDMPIHESIYVHRATRAVPRSTSPKGMCITFLQSSTLELFQKAESEYCFSAKDLPSNLSLLNGSGNTSENQAQNGTGSSGAQGQRRNSRVSIYSHRAHMAASEQSSCCIIV